MFFYSASNNMLLNTRCYLKILSSPLWGGYSEGGYYKNIFPEVPPKSDKHPHKREFSIYYSFTVINVVTFEMNILYIYEILLFCKRNPVKYLTNSSFHTYRTRHGSSLRTPKHRLTLLEKGVHYSSLKYFNMLPAELREERSYSRFSK